MNKAQTLKAAEGMIDILRPVFRCLEIAGSLRREVEKDFDEIDLVGIPDLAPPPYPRAVFGKPAPIVYKTNLDRVLAALALKGSISISESGPRSKKFFSHLFGIRVDLYIVLPPATWGVIQMIRTGPHDFAQWIVTQRHKRGALPDGYRVQFGAVWEGEEKVRNPEGEPIGFGTEEDFFRFLELPYIEPRDRVAIWGKR